ncbi:unnamed protein product [Thlaspi arvense]|uniref:Uncharacterized protein n=1 Tax=Thlaspi arvense TaxID=13288 RepID=A0AAU9RID3_THLAR|nr:unnamed protein product [Thlaspi arvense]
MEIWQNNLFKRSPPTVTSKEQSAHLLDDASPDRAQASDSRIRADAANHIHESIRRQPFHRFLRWSYPFLQELSSLGTPFQEPNYLGNRNLNKLRQYICLDPILVKFNPVWFLRELAPEPTDYREDISEILGQRIRFSDLWDQDEGIAAVVPLRHFGCICWLGSCYCVERSETKSLMRLVLDWWLLVLIRLVYLQLFNLSPWNVCTRILNARGLFYNMQAYDVLGLYYGLGRTFFNPASANVFSRFDKLREATKNYIIKATPEDRSSVLQHLSLHLQISKTYSSQSFTVANLQSRLTSSSGKFNPVLASSSHEASPIRRHNVTNY